MTALTAFKTPDFKRTSSRERALLEYLRTMVVDEIEPVERFHAIFLDEVKTYLGDCALGQGGPGTLSLRMRNLFGTALALDATAILVAHNHPSGLCRPSARDITATRRLKEVALALDIELLDHLIFTSDAAYSIRAGGNL